MCIEFVEEKKDLIQDIPKDRKISKPPKIAQVEFGFIQFTIH